MSVISNNILAGSSGQGGGGDAGPDLGRSLRFNSGDSAYLNRTPSSAGNRRTWTWSGWVKRSKLNVHQDLFTAGGSTSQPRTRFRFQSNNIISVGFNPTGSVWYLNTTSSAYRDTSAWCHIVLVCDTTQSTSSDRLKLYVNGVLQSFGTASYVPQNTQTTINNNTYPHSIGREQSTAGRYFDGYLADIHFIDGQALSASDFGQYDTNNVWQPKEYAGTYGTNGFKLDFSDNSSNAALGTDTSGNGNTWTVNNLSVATGAVTSASGALPIYKTSGAYGDTQVSGLRSDSNASNLSLASALGISGSLDLTDQNVSDRTSSIKTLTNAGAVTTSSSYQFYGGSARFTGASNSFASIASSSDFAFGTGDFTVEFWVKSEATNVNPNFYRRFFTTGPDSAASVQLGHIINTTGVVVFYSSTSVITGTTNILNAWHHVALSRQSGTSRLFVDGVLQGSATDTTNKTNSTPSIGCYNNSNNGRMQGEMQDLRVYKGLAKYTASFTPPSRTLAANTDSLADVPTNGAQTDTGVGGEVEGNYATLNPLHNNAATGGNGAILSDGNLKTTFTSSSSTGNVPATIYVNSGKWYCEFTCIDISGSAEPQIGVVKLGDQIDTYIGKSGNNGVGWEPYRDRRYFAGVYTNNVFGGTTYTSGTPTFGVALDMDDGTVDIYKDGTLLGELATGLSGNWAFAAADIGGGDVPTIIANFGQRAFAYTAPSGYKALCTANLPDPTIADGSTAFDTALYTGNGSTQTISGLGFSPDLVWIKPRSAANDHVLCDIIRGPGVRLFSNSVSAESTAATSLTSFNSDGFSLGGHSSVNTSSVTHVGWAWDAGSSTVTNTDGSISAQVRANPSAGFSIVSWTGDGVASRTVGHGLGIAPAFVVIKQRGTGVALYGWNSYHSALGATKFVSLNLTTGESTLDLFNNTAPTSTVFSLSNVYARINNSSGVAYSAYCFAPVEGYSAIGSYVGNGSNDGSFVYTGFAVKWLLTKASSAGSDWQIWDVSRQPYNVNANTLTPNSSAAESGTSGYAVDLLSNGFKFRMYGSSSNASGVTYIYYALASNPFKTSRAR